MKTRKRKYPMLGLNPRRYLRGVTYPILRMCHCTKCNGTKWISDDGTKWTRKNLDH